MKYAIFFLSCLALTSLQAQPRQKPAEKPRQQRLESMKIGFLTSELDLTPDEAKAFWPVYNAFSEELETLRKSRRSNLAESGKDIDELNDKDIEKLVDNELALRQNELDIMKKYHPQFKQVLPIRKVARLYRAEEGFKRKLLDMLREKREDKRQPER